MELRILAFEDEPADLLLLKETLKAAGLGFQLEVARNREEALALLPRLGADGHQCPDVILMDLQLSDTNGCDLIQLLHDHGLCPDTPIMVLTSCLSCREEEKVRALGVECFMRKPSNLRDYLKIGGQIRHIIEAAK
jgi:two-component system, chemotaxis family, response regulator Rcp1